MRHSRPREGLPYVLRCPVLFLAKMGPASAALAETGAGVTGLGQVKDAWWWRLHVGMSV